MNDLQRKMYLSALGIDAYMPRFRLPYAAISVACKLPISIGISQAIIEYPEDLILATENISLPIQIVKPINSLIAELFDNRSDSQNKFVKNAVINNILQQSSVPNSILMPTLASFSLSVWRPISDLLIIDSRDTKLALPSELLLKNILCHFFATRKLDLKEEVLRWPMIENISSKQTLNEARAELQTWFSVQLEFRSVKSVWLMGENAAKYFLPQECNINNCVWQPAVLFDSLTSALIMPSLNELLQNPIHKNNFYLSIKRNNSFI